VNTSRVAPAPPSIALPIAARPAREPTGSHIPALDGIRGLAVLLVLYCHATVIDVPGALGRAFLASSRLSAAGVDLFFVLSGFLITGILFDAKGKRHFFRNFYARRTVRIFPLYYAFLAAVLIAFPLLLPTWLNAKLGQPPTDGTWYWLYLSNFYQALNPTEHVIFLTWSLAIEEQFYLVWPMVVFLFARKTLLKICCAMFIGSFALRCFVMLIAGADAWRIATSFTFCRLDGLAAGAWIALMVRANGGASMTSAIRSMAGRARFVAPIAGMIILAVVGLSFRVGWRGGIGQSPAYILLGLPAMAMLFGAVLILAVAAPRESWIGRVFNSRFLAVFGKYSYAVYLFHLPVGVMVQHFLLDPTSGKTVLLQLAMQAAYYALTGATSLAAAWVSWHVMEKHFLKLKDLFPMVSKPLHPGSERDSLLPTRAAA
jgi:peptidoglycan/LPS O-acetylase OafA/YrhL